MLNLLSRTQPVAINVGRKIIYIWKFFQPDKCWIKSQKSSYWK